MQFNKEQLITRAKESIAELNLIAISVTGHEAVTVALQIQVEETALAALTAKPSILYYPHTGTIISPGSLGYDVKPGDFIKLYTDAPALLAEGKK